MHRAALITALAAVTACSTVQAARIVPAKPTVSVAAEMLPANADVPVPTPMVQGACPAGMVEVDGTYCPNALEVCLRWVTVDGVEDEAARPTKRYPTSRCGEWRYPTRCLTPESQRPHKHYCIDKYEYPNVEGQRPQSWMDWFDVRDACAAQGKRLCSKEEWTFACEGPDMQPYPYRGHGEHPGYTRDHTSCNTDNHIPQDPVTGYSVNVFSARHPGDRVATILDDLLKPSGSMPDCVSPDGVYDMVGNLDEFIDNTAVPERSQQAPYRSGLMSGHVFGVRNQCRGLTDGHNEWFKWYETGGRCCEDTKE